MEKLEGKQHEKQYWNMTQLQGLKHLRKVVRKIKWIKNKATKNTSMAEVKSSPLEFKNMFYKI